MTNATHIQYAEPAPLRSLALVTAGIMALLAYGIGETGTSLNAYYLYHQALPLTLIGALASFLLGILIARPLYIGGRGRASFRVLYLLFLILGGAVVAINRLLLPERELIAESLLVSSFTMVPLVGTLPLIAGMLCNYLVKISCGEYIDGRPMAALFLMAVFSGIIAGLAIFIGSCYFGPLAFLSILPAVAAIPAAISINLDYSPRTVAASDDAPSPPGPGQPARSPLGNTLLFICYAAPLILVILGYEHLLHRFGETAPIKGTVITLGLIFIPAGFIAGHLARSIPWRNFIEPLAPIFFFTALYVPSVALRLSFTVAALLLTPLMIVCGFSLYHSVTVLQQDHNHDRRSGAMILFLVFIPLALFVAAFLIPLVNIAFLVTAAVVTLLLVVAAAGSGIAWTTGKYRLIAHAIVTPASIGISAALLFATRFPANMEPFSPVLTNVSSICPIQFNSDFIRDSAEVRLGRSRIFSMSDTVYRNLRRAFAPVYLFTENSAGKRLVIDGNLQFYASPIPIYPRGTSILDPIPDGFVRQHTMSCAPAEMAGVTREDILYFFHKRRAAFAAIVDIPNAYELAFSPFRFSPAYVRLIKRSLRADGYFVQVLDIKNCREEFLAAALRNVREQFASAEGYLFGNFAVLLGSGGAKPFAVTEERLKTFAATLKERPELRDLFLNESQPLAGRFFSKDTAGPPEASGRPLQPHRYLYRITTATCAHRLFAAPGAVKPVRVPVIPGDQAAAKFAASIETDLRKNDEIYALLRKADFAALSEEYAAEIAALTELKRIAAARAEAKGYIEHVLSSKERYYFHSGISLEARQMWEEARKRYETAIAINDGNFEANYRLGSLCITIQDFEAALKHLQQAMKLKADNPDVLYQMGVLQFFDYNPQGALEYFKKALALGMKTVPVFINIGLCYEELEQYYDARVYYQEALKLDPKDKNVLSSMERLGAKIDKQKEGWGSGDRRNQQEEEIEEEIPIPINKSAYDKRLSDDQARQYDQGDKDQQSAPAR